MKKGDKVQVHDPSWRDATGREYEAGKHHGKKGVIVAETDYKVGSERLFDVQLDGGLIREFWTNELRPIHE